MSKIKKALEKANTDRKLESFESNADRDFLLNTYQKYQHRSSSYSRSQINTFILLGTAAFILILFFTYVFFVGQKVSKEDLGSFQARLDKFEDQFLMLFEGIEEIKVSLKEQEKRIQAYYLNEDASLKDQVNNLMVEVHQLQKSTLPVALKPKSTYVKKEIPLISNNRYHEVRSGETLYRIGKRYGISVDDLRRMNSLNQSQGIYPGQKLLVVSGNQD